MWPVLKVKNMHDTPEFNMLCCITEVKAHLKKYFSLTFFNVCDGSEKV